MLRAVCVLVWGALVWGAFTSSASAQACEHDDALARAASVLLSEREHWTSREVIDAAHREGSDAPTVHALFTRDEAEPPQWLGRLGGTLRCGRAESERGTLWLAAPALGTLEIVSTDPLRVRASFVVGTGAATLFVLDGHGETSAFAVSGSPTELDLGRDVALPATLQLVAAHADGPRPVAERTLGEPPRRALGADGSIRTAVEALRSEVDVLPLRTSRLVARIAREHAAEVCRTGHVAHVIEEGDAEARLLSAGVEARHVGEVVARGASLGAAWEALTASPSHRGALTDARFTDVGIGEATDDAGRSCVVVILAAWPRRVR